STCASGSDGDSPWAGNWTDAGDGSVGFCQGVSNADVEVMRDGAFGYGLRIKDNDRSARRSVNLNGATKAFLTFAYRRKSATLTSGEDVYVQVSSNGSTFSTIYTITGNGTTDANYVTIYNQDITSYASSTTAIRILTNTNVDDADTVYIDNISIRYLKYPQCYITAIASSSIPAFYSMTTVSQKTMTIVAGGSCTSAFDFGLAKNSITVSGTLHNDKNGLTDNIVNGATVGSPSGATVYAYLVDVSGNVAFKTTVNGSTGAYSFPLAEVNTDYTLILSTSDVALGSNPPAPGGFNPIWGSVGDAYGTNNLAGTGNETGTPDVSIAVKTGASNVTNVNFGIQRLPNSDSYLSSINHPSINQIITLNGVGMNPPVLSGSDPEDCTSGCVLTTKSVTIDQVPVNAELYYNSALVSNGQTITNFNPDLFQVKITPAAIGDSTVTFSYSYVDAAVMKDPTPATYTLIWLVVLPADGLTALANLNGNIATVKWSTLSEQNTSHFVVERSLDNKDFTPTGNTVDAAGYSVEKREYQLQDDISGLLQNKAVYYRVKLVDMDGKVKYSNVVVVKLSQKLQVAAWPNPFQSSVTISVTSDKATTFDIRMIDINGKLIRKMSQSVAKGTTQIALRDFDRLPTGIYLLEMIDERSGTSTVQRLMKN
ncbi:MAG TPA: T9SS type A sorting domain-containing protein, partial [Chitinophagaceae bacterium]|nr:T9SS type A sorting domain-containing protein [Chitinophagaceae bacterium]